MNSKINIIFCLLFLTILFFIPTAYATDYEEHWAKQEIEKLIDEEAFVISGDSFYPDDDATVNQICHAFCYVLGIPNVDSTMSDLELAKQNDLFLDIQMKMHV